MQIPCSTTKDNGPGESLFKSIVLRTITALRSEFDRQLEISHYASLTSLDLKSVVENRILKFVEIEKLLPIKYQPRARFACWNARSINNKTTAITDFIVSEQLDVMAVTETWLYGDRRDDRTLADIYNSLKDFNIIQVARKNTKGGGVAVFHRKGLSL